MDKRPCYKYFYDLDALWIHAIGTNPPGSPRMHNMAKDQGWNVVPNAHSGIHDTLQVLVDEHQFLFFYKRTFNTDTLFEQEIFECYSKDCVSPVRMIFH